MASVRGAAAAGLLASGLALAPGEAPAATMLFDFVETGGNVVGTLSGSLDLSTLQGEFPSMVVVGSMVRPGRGDIVAGGLHEATPILAFGQASPFALPNPVTGDVLATSWDGPRFALQRFGGGNFIFLPEIVRTGPEQDDFLFQFPSGDPLSGTLLFENTTLAGMGVTPGTYVYEFQSDPEQSITLRFTPIPLPGALPLLLGALGLMALLRRRTRV